MRGAGAGGGLRGGAGPGQRILAAGGAHSLPGLRPGGHRPQPAHRLHRPVVPRHRRLHGGRRLRRLQADHRGAGPQHRDRLPVRRPHGRRGRPGVRAAEPAHQGAVPGGGDPGGAVLPHLAVQPRRLVLQLQPLRHHHGAAAHPAGHHGDRPGGHRDGALPDGAELRGGLRADRQEPGAQRDRPHLDGHPRHGRGGGDHRHPAADDQAVGVRHQLVLLRRRRRP